RVVKQRALLLLAAAISVALVFVGGYAVGNRGGSASGGRAWKALALRGTSIVPQAQGTLRGWQAGSGSQLPMKVSVAGLPKLPGKTNYEVYLVRNGKPWGSCGSFTVTGRNGDASVTLNAPYTLQPGDSWVVTRPGAGGVEPGQTVLRPVTA